MTGLCTRNPFCPDCVIGAGKQEGSKKNTEILSDSARNCTCSDGLLDDLPIDPCWVFSSHSLEIKIFLAMATSQAYAQLLSVVADDSRSQITLWLSSVILGILACKTIYNVMKAVSPLSPHYTRLSKPEKIEWDNRGFSTAHSIAISTAAIYFIFISDLFKDDAPYGPVVFRSSMSSQIILGMSIGYFISDLGMILWFYPTLGGKEYIVHHVLSMASLALSVYNGEGSFYVYMMLLSESTTPFVNLRWYLSVAGMKNSKAYVINGVFLFLGWMVARILLFVFFFFHLYNHFDQVKQMFAAAYYCLLAVPPCLAILNLAWFIKIIRGFLRTFFKKV